MARIAYGMCNVVTGDDSTSYRRSDNSEPAPQVTIPHHHAHLTIHEAKALAEDLGRAAAAWKERSDGDARVKQAPATRRPFLGRLFSFSTTEFWYDEFCNGLVAQLVRAPA